MGARCFAEFPWKSSAGSYSVTTAGALLLCLFLPRSFSRVQRKEQNSLDGRQWPGPAQLAAHRLTAEQGTGKRDIFYFIATLNKGVLGGW